MANSDQISDSLIDVRSQMFLMQVAVQLFGRKGKDVLAVAWWIEYDKVSREFNKRVPRTKKLITRPIMAVTSPNSPHITFTYMDICACNVNMRICEYGYICAV